MRAILVLTFIVLCALAAAASVFGSLHGLVHDAEHRPIAGAQVTVRAAHSEWKRTLRTDASGRFLLEAVPAGEYTIEASASGFATLDPDAFAATLRATLAG